MDVAYRQKVTLKRKTVVPRQDRGDIRHKPKSMHFNGNIIVNNIDDDGDNNIN